MTKEEIIEMFTRIPMPPGQINLYKALYEANPRSLTSEEIADLMREGDANSLNMLLQALANRITRQDGGAWKDVLPKIFYLLPRDNTTELRMRNELRDAIESCPNLLEIIQTKTVQEIYEEYGRYPLDNSKYLRLEC